MGSHKPVEHILDCDPLGKVLPSFESVQVVDFLSIDMMQRNQRLAPLVLVVIERARLELVDNRPLPSF